MTDTQYRVLGDLVAGGYIFRVRLSRGEYLMYALDGRLIGPVSGYMVRCLLQKTWIANSVRSWKLGIYRITDAGRAAYAQAQARRAAQEATG